MNFKSYGVIILKNGIKSNDIINCFVVVKGNGGPIKGLGAFGHKIACDGSRTLKHGFRGDKVHKCPKYWRI